MVRGVKKMQEIIQKLLNQKGILLFSLPQDGEDINTLIKKLQCSRPTIFKTIKQLENIGLITIMYKKANKRIRLFIIPTELGFSLKKLLEGSQ